jgi:hypothetical protein
VSPCLSIGSIVIGVVLAKAIEVPFLNLRDRILPSRSDALKVSSSSDDGLALVAR